jgi:hypothetical protein
LAIKGRTGDQVKDVDRGWFRLTFGADSHARVGLDAQRQHEYMGEFMSEDRIGSRVGGGKNVLHYQVATRYHGSVPAQHCS